MSTQAVIGGIIVLVLIIGGAFFFMNRTPAEEVTLPSDQELQDQAMMEHTEGTLHEADVPVVNTMPESGTAETTTTTRAEGNVKEFTIEGNTQFRFNPSEIRVNQGDTVRITFKNVGGVHDWKLDEFNAATEVIQAGQEQTIEFVASRAGTFQYYCSVGNHRAMGMVGNLIVQ